MQSIKCDKMCSLPTTFLQWNLCEKTLLALSTFSSDGIGFTMYKVSTDTGSAGCGGLDQMYVSFGT